MPEVVNENTLNCAYFALFFIGVGYAIIILITGGLGGDVDVPQVDVDVPQIDLPGDVGIDGAEIHIGGPEVPSAGLDAADVPVSPLSPITIATFITSFGGIGVLSTQFFGVDGRWSLVWATVGGLLLSAVMFLFYSQVLAKAQGSSEVHSQELVGVAAEVTVPIRAGAPGQVSYITKSGRMISPARSLDDAPIGRGQLVEIVRVVGSSVVVRPLPANSAD